MIESSILGRDGDRFRIAERHQILEFGSAESRQRHDWNRTNLETRESQRRELDAIGQLDNDSVIALDPIAREECGELFLLQQPVANR